MTKDYTATKTANVVSTAGDATLSVTDPSSTAPGHLVNGSFALPQALQASATSPAGNGGAFARGQRLAADAAHLAVPGLQRPGDGQLQAVDRAGDALRTGSYSKTLTYTLSTTQP